MGVVSGRLAAGAGGAGAAGTTGVSAGVATAGAVTAEGKKLDGNGLAAAFAFTRRIYALLKAEKVLELRAGPKPSEVVDLL